MRRMRTIVLVAALCLGAIHSESPELAAEDEFASGTVRDGLVAPEPQYGLDDLRTELDAAFRLNSRYEGLLQDHVDTLVRQDREIELVRADVEQLRDAVRTLAPKGPLWHHAEAGRVDALYDTMHRVSKLVLALGERIDAVSRTCVTVDELSELQRRYHGSKEDAGER